MRPNFTFRKIFLLLFSFLIFNCSFLIATVRYVSKTGSSIPPYTTWETAADSIQKCINISVFGDTIYVANGVYQERVVMIPGLSLIGAGTDSCEINTQPFATTTSYRSVVVNDSCLFKGFKIVVANNTDFGGGISGTAINSLITENRITKAKYGISNGSDAIIYKNIIDNISTGMDIVNSNALIRNNSVYTDPNSGAAIVSGIQIAAFTNTYTPIIDSNYIVAGRGQGIRKDLGASPTISNNYILLADGVPDGIRSGIDGNLKIFNNKIIAKVGYDGIYKNGSTLKVINNYVSGPFIDYGIIVTYDTLKNNVVTGAVRGIGSAGSSTVQFNNSWNNETNYVGFTPDTTNLSVDPMIVNDDTTQGDLDFHLQMFSPLIDAGDPNILDKDSTRSDIGLYGGPYGESYIYFDLPPRPPVNLTVDVDSLIKLNWNRNTEADFNYFNVYRDTTFDFIVDSTKLIASVTDTFYYQTFPSNIETLYYKLTAVDNQGNESNPSEQVSVKLVTVKNEWVPVNNYILYQNYPNPFNPSTKISYKLKERGYVKLYVYDIKGELVSVLVNEVQESGYYEVDFNTTVSHSGEVRNLASGVYIYQIFVQGENNISVFSDIKKMIHVK
jgi:hypothetical protein